MRIAQAMFDPIPLDDDPVLDETLRPFLEEPSGLMKALKAGTVSDADRVRITPEANRCINRKKPTSLSQFRHMIALTAHDFSDILGPGLI